MGPGHRQPLLCKRLRAPGTESRAPTRLAFLLRPLPLPESRRGAHSGLCKAPLQKWLQAAAWGKRVTRRMAWGAPGWGAHKQHGLVCSSRASGAQTRHPDPAAAQRTGRHFLASRVLVGSWSLGLRPLLWSDPEYFRDSEMIIVELSVLNIGGGRSEAVLLEIITDYQTNSQGRLWHFLF